MPELDKKAVWPGWETVRLIGCGSFGSVYEIERELLGEKEKAALKVITIPQSSSDIDEMYGEGYDDESITTTFKTYLKNIIAEYSLMRKMNGSSNVVNCDDVQYVQHDDGMGWDIFIKMELLTPLTKALGKDVSDEQVVRIGSDICKALTLCKKHNIIHRDIKPANIFVSENGDYKLGDFGIAKTVEKTSGGTKIGTYEYMAPEVYHDKPYGSTADIYSLGMVLYWMLNERRTPFLKLPPELPTASEKEAARKRRFSGEELPEPAHGSTELKQIVQKACAYDPKDRYQSAEEMLQDLKKLSGNVHTPRQDAQNVFGDDVDQAAAEEESSVSALYQNVDYNEGTTAGFFRKPTPAKEEPAAKLSSSERKQMEEPGTVNTMATGRGEAGEDGTVGVFSRPKPAEAPAKAPDPPKKNGKALVFTLVAVLAAIAIGVGFFLFRAPKDTAKDYVLISEKRTYSDGANLQIYYCYDEHAGRTESYYFGDNESYIGTYICDENGNIMLCYDHNGRVTSYEYDENNKCVKENNYYSEDELKDDSPFLVSEYGYDNAGRRTMWKQTHYDDDGFSSTTTLGEYKGYKRVGASVVYANGDVDHIRVDATYDKNGDETSATFYRENDAEPYSKETYEYDENRNLIRKVLSGSYGETIYKYEYKLRSEIIAEGGYTPPVSAPEPEHLSEEQLQIIPDWYYDDCVTIYGNQICFSRTDGYMWDRDYITFVEVYTYDEQGQIYDMRAFDFFPSAEAAERSYQTHLDFRNGTNCDGYTEEQVHYGIQNDVLMTVYEEVYYKDLPCVTLDGTIEYYSGYNWNVYTIESNDRGFRIADSSRWGEVLINGSWENGSISIAAVEERTFHVQLIDERPDRIEVPELGTRWSLVVDFGPMQYSEAMGNSHYLDDWLFYSDAEVYTSNQYNLKDGMPEMDWNSAFSLGKFQDEGITWEKISKEKKDNESLIPIYDYTIEIPNSFKHSVYDIESVVVFTTDPANYNISQWDETSKQYSFGK